MLTSSPFFVGATTLSLVLFSRTNGKSKRERALIKSFPHVNSILPASRIPQRQLQTIDGIHPIDTTGYNAKCYCGGLSAHPECYNAYYCCLYCKCDSCPSDPFSCRNHAESCGCPTFNGFTSDAELFENDNNLKV